VPDARREPGSLSRRWARVQADRRLCPRVRPQAQHTYSAGDSPAGSERQCPDSGHGCPRRGHRRYRSVCRWNTDMYGVDMTKKERPEYYAGLAKMYAAWGIDYIKADDEGAPLYRPEVAALHSALERSGRPIVLSISPGSARVEDADFLAANAELWRASNDLWEPLARSPRGVRVAAPVEPVRRSGSVAGCRHVAAGPHRLASRTWRRPHEPAHSAR
jgi:hypothetical protein